VLRLTAGGCRAAHIKQEHKRDLGLVAVVILAVTWFISNINVVSAVRRQTILNGNLHNSNDINRNEDKRHVSSLGRIACTQCVNAMRLIATEVARSVVCVPVSVCVLETRVSCEKND